MRALFYSQRFERCASWYEFLLLLFAFAIPWEYSLDLGAPVGNIARVLGLLVLAAAVPAVLLSGRMRRPGALQWLVLGLFLWFCCSSFWTVDRRQRSHGCAADFQVMMVVWLGVGVCRDSGGFARPAPRVCSRLMGPGDSDDCEPGLAGGGGADSICGRGTGSERCGALSRSRISDGGAACWTASRRRLESSFPLDICRWDWWESC